MDKHDIHKLDKSNCLELLATDGIVLFRNCPGNHDRFSDLLGKLQIFSNLSTPSHISYRPEISGQSNIKGYSNLGLYPHTDRSGLVLPPKYVIGKMSEASQSGGASLFADGIHIHQQLGDWDAEALRHYEQPTIAVFRRKNKILSAPIFETVENRLKKIRFRNDDEIYLNQPGRKFWSKLLDVIDRSTKKVKLAAGDGYIIDNHRILHGRTAFSGTRVFTRFLAD